MPDFNDGQVPNMYTDSADTVIARMSQYYFGVSPWWTYLSGTKTLYDADGAETADFTEAVQIMYEFTLWKRINGVTFNDV